MHKLNDVMFEAFHTFFRNFNFPCDLGLFPIGNPGRSSPVFLSGNYSLVVHRLRRAVEGIDCYLLVANSRGSNVWCAAGMNEFSEHDVIDAINVGHLASVVSHRQIIAPPYAAPGVNVRAVYEETGFHLKWGPTHLNDLRRYIGQNFKRSNDMLSVQFGLRDRIEQALANTCCYSMTIAPALLFWPRYILAVLGIIALTYLSGFAFWYQLPRELHRRHTLGMAFGLSMALLALGMWNHWSAINYLKWEATLLGVVLLVAMDACGSTPIFKTTISHWLRDGNYESLFDPVIDPERCTNCMDCVLVCPKGVFAARRDGSKKVVAVRPRECIDCLACVKQCYDDAFFNRSGKYKGDVKSIPNLDHIMTRDCSHLKNEDRWINFPVTIRNGLPVLAESIEEKLQPEKVCL